MISKEDTSAQPPQYAAGTAGRNYSLLCIFLASLCAKRTLVASHALVYFGMHLELIDASRKGYTSIRFAGLAFGAAAGAITAGSGGGAAGAASGFAALAFVAPAGPFTGGFGGGAAGAAIGCPTCRERVVLGVTVTDGLSHCEYMGSVSPSTSAEGTGSVRPAVSSPDSRFLTPCATGETNGGRDPSIRSMLSSAAGGCNGCRDS